MNNRQRANGITAGIISIMLGIVLLAIIFPYHFLGISLIVSASICLYFMFKTIRNTVKVHLDKEELNRQYMNKIYREAKDKMGQKPKMTP